MEKLEKLSLDGIERTSGSSSARPSGSESARKKKAGKLASLKNKVVGITSRQSSEAKLDMKLVMSREGAGHKSLGRHEFNPMLEEHTRREGSWNRRARERRSSLTSQRKTRSQARAKSDAQMFSSGTGDTSSDDSDCEVVISGSADAVITQNASAIAISPRSPSMSSLRSYVDGGRSLRRSHSAEDLAKASAGFRVVHDDDSKLEESILQEPSQETGSWSSGEALSAIRGVPLEDGRAETPSVRRAKFLERFQAEKEEDSDSDTEDPLADRVSGTNKTFHKRFKNMPDEVVNENFLCALLLKGGLLSQGSMYITTGYVCFYSNIFGKKTRVAIPFGDILSIRKCKILKSIPNSIEIHTPEKKYFWASFLHRDVAYDLISRRWRAVRKKLGDPVPDDLTYPSESESSKPDLGFDWDLMEEDSFADEDSMHRSPPTCAECSHDLEATSAKTMYKEDFPITAYEFYLHFLSDRSNKFWSEFHSKDGYHDFDLTPWDTSPEGCCVERQAEFRAPIPMSLAPKFTRVTQQQRCRFASKNVVVFSTSSHSRDVPYSNHFLVNSNWQVVDTTPGSCSVTVTVFVRFTRNNWLKSMIERNAIGGSRDWFENFIKSALAVAHLIKQNSLKPREQQTPQIDVLRQSMRLSSDSPVLRGLRNRNLGGSGGLRRSSLGVPLLDSEDEEEEEAEGVAKWRQEVLRVYNVLGEAAGQSMRAVAIVVALFLVTLFLVVGTSLFFYIGSLSDDVVALEAENVALKSQMAYLQSVLSMATKATPGTAELVGEHSDFWRARGALEIKLAAWEELAKTVQVTAKELSTSLRSFSLPKSATDEAFVAAVAEALGTGGTTAE